ncbi:MAG: tetratricopeptide repeat protein [bacterium]|nr:tetratricopeptide repeat protein [bacterium]
MKGCFYIGCIILILLIKVNASSVDDQYNEANKLIQNGARKEALILLRKLSKNYPLHPLRGNFHFWAGHVLMQMNKLEEACMEFSLATSVKYSNKVPDALFALGNCYEKIGRKELAKKEWEKFLKLYPNHELVKTIQKRLNQ